MDEAGEDLHDDDELHEAARLGDVEAVQQALGNGCDPDTIGLLQWNSLHEAAFNGYFDILKLLLDHKADPNLQDLLDKNTALHHACSERHPDCVEALLNAGARGDLLNSKKESPCDLASDSRCVEILSQHGYVSSRKKSIKSILKPVKEARSVSKAKHDVVKPSTSSISPTKPFKVMIERQSDIVASDNLPSPTSVDSGRFSSHIKSSPSKQSWDSLSDGLLRIPSSPARSIGSSYGSLTSLGSSGCSVADDCSGQFVLSFQYNSKKEEFKIRLWEIRLITLLPPSKMLKDISIDMYVSSVIIPGDNYQADLSLKKKSDVFRLYPGEHLPSDTQCFTKSSWSEREARLEFKSSISLEYNKISKNQVNKSTIKVSLSIQRKRSFLSSKKFSSHHDPVLASVELEMKEAVKLLKKLSYDTERHDVVGITRQIMPLDAVVAENFAYENRSFNSDPSVLIGMSTLPVSTDQILRSSSVGDLKSLQSSQSHLRSKVGDHSQHVIETRGQSHSSSTVDLSSQEGRDNSINKLENYSVSSLDSVVSHTSAANPTHSSHRLNAVQIGQSKSKNDDSQVRVAMPISTSFAYDEFNSKLRKGEKSKTALTQKAKNKLKNGGRSIVTTASTIVRPRATAGSSLDDEERSVGSPEKAGISAEEYFHHRFASSNSLVEIDESSTRIHSRRTKPFSPSPQTRHHRKPISSAKMIARPTHLTLNIDPRNNTDDIERTFFVSNAHNDKQRTVLNTKTELKSKQFQNNLTLSATRLHAKDRVNHSKVLRKLVYDETSVNDDVSTVENPHYISD